MRLGSSVPETPGLIPRGCLEEVGKVAGVVVVGNSTNARVFLAGRKSLAGNQAMLPLGILSDSWSPALPV